MNLHAGLNPVAQVEQAAVRRVESIAHRAESALMCKRRVTTPARVLDRGAEEDQETPSHKGRGILVQVPIVRGAPAQVEQAAVPRIAQA